MDPQSEGYDRGRVGGTESSPGMLCGKTEDLVFVLKQRQKTVRDVTLAICEFLEKEEIQKQVKVLENQLQKQESLHLQKNMHRSIVW